MLRLRHRLSYFKFTFKQYLQLKEKKDFRTILNANKDTKYQQLRANFFQLIKEYHPDKSILNPNLKKGECEEITKIITEAYASLTNDHIRNKSEGTKMSGRAYEPVTEEEKIYYEVFKKSRHEDPYAFYKAENEGLKKEYLRKIEEMATNTAETRSRREDTNREHTKEEKKEESHHPSFIPFLVAGSGAIAALLYYFYLPKHQEPNLQPITDEKISAYEQKWKSKLLNRAENIRSQYQIEQTPSLEWHPFGQIPILQQLMKFTIFQDLELFEVHPSVFESKEFEFSSDKLTTSRLDRMRPNTLMTLSLEAERCLHNIYVSKEYLTEELKTKGYFQCPGVFFRFHGYIYFKLRPKKLNLQNYKGEKWISLFDLYFKYYSPAYYYADYFDTHFTAEREASLFGDIHFNTRTIPLHHLKPEQKNVYMWAPKGGDYKWNEEKYKSIWTNYYSFHMPMGTKEEQ